MSACGDGSGRLGTHEVTSLLLWDLHGPVSSVAPGSHKPRDLVGVKRLCWGVTPVHLEKGLPGLCDPGYLGHWLQGTSGKVERVGGCWLQPPMKTKAWQAEPWGDAWHEPHVFAHIKPLFLQGRCPQDPKKAQGLQGWLVSCFRASTGLPNEGEKYAFLVSKQSLTLLPLKHNSHKQWQKCKH